MIYDKIEVKFKYIEEVVIDNYPQKVETEKIDKGYEQKVTSARYFNNKLANMEISRVIKVRSFLINKNLREVEISGKRYKVLRSQEIQTSYSILELEEFN